MMNLSFGTFTFNENEIELNPYPDTVRVNSPMSDTLEADAFKVIVRTDALGERKVRDNLSNWLATKTNQGIVIDKGNILDYEYGEELSVYDGSTLKAKFYITDIDRVGLDQFEIQACSAVGLLTKMHHKGGIYSNVSAGTLIAELMGSLPYTIDADVSATKLYGWLPNTAAYADNGMSARDSLKQVLFATGASIVKNASGNVRFTFNVQQQTKEIPASRIFLSGPVRETTPSVTKVTVIEHTYYQSAATEEEVVYDASQGLYVSNYEVAFTEPYHSYRGDGLTIVDSGANYAVISGSGILYAKKYVHIKREVSKNTGIQGKKKEVSVSNATLVSSLNVVGVVDRLTDFYSKAINRRFAMIVSGEKAGDLVSYTDRYDEDHTGYITRLEETQSSFSRGQVEVVTDWAPTTPSNDYDTSIIITADDLTNGVYNVPAEYIGKRAYLVLFSGAQGGQGGYAGETPLGNLSDLGQQWHYGQTQFDLYGAGLGETNLSYDNRYYIRSRSPMQLGGAGGLGGEGGASASRMLQTNINSLASSYAVSFGAGGAGGAGGTAVEDTTNGNVIVTPPGLGADGANSTWGTYNTANGAVFKGTYVDMVTGNVIAKAGAKGVAGSKGGNGGQTLRVKSFKKSDYATSAEWIAAWQDYDYSAVDNAWGKQGANFGSYTGGSPGTPQRGYGFVMDNFYRFWAGNSGSGGGGGAAYGANGNNGQNGYTSTYRNEDSDYVIYVGEKQIYTNPNGEIPPVVTFKGNCGGAGADVVGAPSKPLLVGGTGGFGGGGGGGAGQTMTYAFASPGNYDYAYGTARGGKGGNGGQGGQGSDGFAILYVKSN